MGDINQKKLKAFFKKSEKFFNSYYPILKDENELPTVIKTEESNYSLTHSIDRHHARWAIIKDLQHMMGFTESESTELADYYVDLKYSEYKKFILSA